MEKTPPKLQVKVTADASGSETTVHSSGLSVRRLLKFSVSATLGGKDLTPEELGELLSNGDGLIRFKGGMGVCGRPEGPGLNGPVDSSGTYDELPRHPSGPGSENAG